MPEINGFEVDVFNQYDLKVDAKDSHCPLCSHKRKPANQKAKCASLDWKRAIGTCHHCSDTFQLHTFKRKTDKVYIKPVRHERSEISTNIITYFANRGISLRTLQSAKVTAIPKWIEFNYYINNELINVKSRNGKKEFRLIKGAEKVLYNLDNTIGHDYIIIVEGEIDALSCIEAGYPSAVSVPNGATIGRNNLDYMDNCIDHFEGKAKVILATDNDEAGAALRTELIRRLGSEVCHTVEFGSYKDLNEALVDGGVGAVRYIIDNAQLIPLENVLTLNDIKDELKEFVTDGARPGFGVGLPNFDDIFTTYTGQFITVTGIPSSGKSDFVDQMVVGYNHNYGWKVAFVSPENKPTYLHVHKLIRKIGNWKPSKEDLDGDKWNRISEHINDNFYFVDFDKYNLDAVLKKGAELVKRKGIRVLVLDPFNKIRQKGYASKSITEYTMDYLTSIENFARKYDVLVIIVAHPTKMYKDTTGKQEEPTMYNIKGGGEWFDASYHGLLVHRDYDKNTVKVKVLKVKFQHLGENNAEVHFTWDRPSGLFVPHYPEEEVPW